MPAIEAIRLSQLATKINTTLQEVFAGVAIWVLADVSNHTYKPGTNYHYFELVEKGSENGQLIARFPAKAWGAGAKRIQDFEEKTGQRFSGNIHILALVSIDHHPIYGIQLNLIDIDTNYTIGLIEQQRQATLDRLVKENPSIIRRSADDYLTKNKEIPLPPVLQKIAVISSKNSAGLQDFLHTLEHNNLGYYFETDCFYTEVQGENNAPGIREALIDIYNAQKKYDLVVLVRGGGSQTDLLLFDHYQVGQAIARFPIPIITGIGHTKNITIADLMAHTAVKTPTKCAEFIIEHNRRFEEGLLNIRQKIIIRSQQYLSVHQRQLRLFQQLVTVNATQMVHHKQIELARIKSQFIIKPLTSISEKQQQLERLSSHIALYSKIRIRDAHQQLAHFSTIIQILDPENILKRGFALVSQNGKITTDPETLKNNTDIHILLGGMLLTALLKEKKHDNGRKDQL